jgi:hypothetical protein
LRQTTALVGQLSVFTQVLDRDPIGVLDRGLSATSKRGPLSKRIQLPPQRVLASTVAPAMS